MTIFQTDESDADDPVNRSDGKIDLADENDERLSNRQEAKNRRVLADVAKITPVEPLLRIPEAEQNEDKNAADNNSRVRAFEQLPHFACRSISDYLPRQSHPGFVTRGSVFCSLFRNYVFY